MNTDNDIPDEEFKEIERFLRHDMLPEEQESFEQRVSMDKILKEQVDELRLLLLGIQESALHEKLHQFHKEIPIATAKHWHFKKWLIAASVIVCLSVAGWWYSQAGDKNQQLFAEYFQPDPGLISGMGSPDDYAFDRAMIDYKTGHYKEAIQAWKGIQQSKTANDTLEYFIGSAYLALKESKTAAPYFQKVIAHTNSTFTEEANWYLGLALLQEGKTIEALPYIRQSSRKEKDTLISKLQQ